MTSDQLDKSSVYSKSGKNLIASRRRPRVQSNRLLTLSIPGFLGAQNTGGGGGGGLLDPPKENQLYFPGGLPNVAHTL